MALIKEDINGLLWNIVYYAAFKDLEEEWDNWSRILALIYLE
jgi:hypothetical protein